MRGFMRPITNVQYTRFWINRIKYFSISSRWLKNYRRISGSIQCIKENVCIILCAWMINASNPAISLTISTMTMNRMYVPG